MPMDRRESHRPPPLPLRAGSMDQTSPPTPVHPQGPHRPGCFALLPGPVPGPPGRRPRSSHLRPLARQPHPMPVVRHQNRPGGHRATPVRFRSADILNHSGTGSPGDRPHQRFDTGQLRSVRPDRSQTGPDYPAYSPTGGISVMTSTRTPSGAARMKCRWPKSSERISSSGDSPPCTTSRSHSASTSSTSKFSSRP